MANHMTQHMAQHEEYQYLNLLKDIYLNGNRRGDRTGTGTLSLFGEKMKFNLTGNVVPILTTKRVFVRGVIEELLWIISRSTDAGILRNKNIHIWEWNSTREFLDGRGLNHLRADDIGAGYGFQWRHSGANYISCNTDYSGQGVDQLQDVINLIKDNPTSRRILMSAWNPSDLSRMALPPCHVQIQFYVNGDELSSCMYQRSGDMGLGVPFNITFYSLFTHMIAHVTGKRAVSFTHIIGDAHVYLNHIEAVKEQIAREPLSPFPTLRLNNRVGAIDDFTYDDFEIENYKPQKVILMDMAV